MSSVNKMLYFNEEIHHDKLKAITREIITFRYVKIYQVFSGSEIKFDYIWCCAVD